MSSSIDLHIHTDFSQDGEILPEEIVNLALKEGVGTIAITDHNSVRGNERAIAYGRSKGLKVIPGIEIDCNFQGTNLHLLGYNIDYRDKDFYALEEYILDNEREQNKEMLKLIQEYTGIKLNEEEAYKRSKFGLVNGELIAELYLEDDKNRNVEILKPYYPGGLRSEAPLVNFYWDFFAQGKPCYVPIEYPSLKKALELIKKSGGVSVLAHPDNNIKSNRGLLEGIISQGVEGIEVFSTYHNNDATDFYLDKAREKNLLITCGSDFHGKIKPHIKIGGVYVYPEIEIIV